MENGKSKIRNGKSLLYSSGNFAASLTGSVFSTYVTFYYVDVLKMPAALISLAMSIYGIWNAVNDPLLGQISDRTRSRWGRRIPYLLFGSIPFALLFTLVWTPPLQWLGGNTTAMFVYFISVVFLFDFLYTLVIINWTALFPEMYKTQEERTKVSTYRQVFGIIANILGVALPPVLYTAFGWPFMGILFGFLTLVFLYMSLAGSKEDPQAAASEGLPLLKSLKATFSNRSFLIYVLAAMFVQFTFVMLQAALPFYAKYVLDIEGFQVSLMLGVIFIMAMLWIPFWQKRANRIGSKKAIIISSTLYAVSLLPLWFVKNYIGGIISSALIGIGLAGLMLLLDVMLSDIVDEDELKTGARREGMYFGINGLMVRLAISFQSAIMGAVLSTSGYNAELPVNSQPESAIIGIKMLLVVIPMISVAIAILFYLKYPLYGKRLQEVKEQIRRLHEAPAGTVPGEPGPAAVHAEELKLRQEDAENAGKHL